MKKLLPLIAPLVLFITVGFYNYFANRDYITTIYAIQTVPQESLAIGHDRSPKVGDTVTVTGRVIAPPRVNPSGGDYRVLLRGSNSRQAYIADTLNNVWGGIVCRQADTITTNTFFDLIDSGSKVTVTGVVQEFPDIISSGLTQIGFDSTYSAIQVLPTVKRRPTPIQVNVSVFDSLGTIKFTTGEKYEGMYVQFNNLTVGPQGSGARHVRALLDAQGNKIYLRDFSNFFSTQPTPSYGWPTWVPPSVGATVNFIRGVIINAAYADGPGGTYPYVIVPIYPNDLQLGNTPPFISTVTRIPGVPKPTDSVQVNATVTDTLDHPLSVDSVQLVYRINKGQYTSIRMLNVGNIFYAKMPPRPLGTLVEYFVRARDNQSGVRLNPADTSRSTYFYFVRSSDTMTIKDIQYTPNQGGYSGYNGYDVTTEGVVTCDTSDMNSGSYSSSGGSQSWARKVFIQDPNIAGGWSGIWIAGNPTDVLVRGQRVRVRGTVQEDNGMTKLNIATSGDIVVISANNPLPNPEILTPGVVANSKADGDTTAEKWEGVLIRFSNLVSISCIVSSSSTGCTSTLPVPDSSFRRNYGEIFGMYTSENIEARIELQDGTHNFTNGWDSTKANYWNPNLPGTLLYNWNGFQGLTGILFYGFSRYKLIPRKNDDFGAIIGIQNNQESPSIFWLSQNYPNPFNPVTNITYNLPVDAEVKLTVYNILGQEVKVLVDGLQNSGKYTVHFDGTNLASGMYIYRLEGESAEGKKFSDIKKMVIVK